MFNTETDPYTPFVQRIMRIDNITWGKPPKEPIVKYRGEIYREDTAHAYDELNGSLRPFGVTPLFRLENGQHSIHIINGVIQPKPSDIRWNIIMFLLSAISVLLAGVIYSYQGPVPQNAGLVETLGILLQHLDVGLPFAVSFLGILLAHEFGHYLAARHHKTQVSLPYFIPFPLSPFGTMGAFIQAKEPPRNKRTMLDIGIAGPLAGMVVAIPVLIYGLLISKMGTLPVSLDSSGLSLEGNSLLYLFLKFITKGQLLPAPISYGDVSPIFYWVRYLLTSTPLPFGARDVLMSPVAWAGWAGLLITSLNLIPAGQLDGGHIVYVLLGKRAIRLWPFILGALVLLGFVWEGWWLWAFLIFFLGRTYMEPLDQITPLDDKRRILAVVGIILFILVFMPVPLTQVAPLNGF